MTEPEEKCPDCADWRDKCRQLRHEVVDLKCDIAEKLRIINGLEARVEALAVPAVWSPFAIEGQRSDSDWHWQEGGAPDDRPQVYELRTTTYEGGKA